MKMKFDLSKAMYPYHRSVGAGKLSGQKVKKEYLTKTSNKKYK